MIDKRARVIAALATVVLTSCSGGENELSAVEFRGQANAICERYDQDIEALGTPETEAEIRAHVERVLPIVRREIDELDALHPPAQDAEAFDAMVADLERTVAATEDLGAAFAHEPVDDAAVAAAFDRANAAGNRADERARSLGLDECVEAEEDE